MNDQSYVNINSMIGRFSEGDLSREEEEWLLGQAAVNPLLRNDLRLDRDLEELLSDPGKLALSETIRAQIHHEKKRIEKGWILKIAAGFALMMVIGTLLLSIGREGDLLRDRKSSGIGPVKGKEVFDFSGYASSVKMQKVSDEDAGRRLFGQENLAACFAPRPEYEFLIGSASRDLSVFLVQPGPRTVCSFRDVLEFSWRWLDDIQPVTISITDNRGKEVWKKDGLTVEKVSIPLKGWNRGLYYYRVLAREELVSLGSITIK